LLSARADPALESEAGQDLGMREQRRILHSVAIRPVRSARGTPRSRPSTAGGVTFMLGRRPDALPVASIGDHGYVAYLDVDDVDAFHERAIAAGADVQKPPTDEPWGRREMALRSPDGHRFTIAT
jgi:uncharacterized glyoxalase superfamily protein PhnB